MITTHRFPFFGCNWHLEIDQDAQEIVQVECNGERFEAGINDYVAVKKADTFKIQHITNALYDMAQEVGEV